MTIPVGVSPPVALLFSEMRRLQVTYDEVQEASGTTRATIKAWRKKNAPSLDTIQSCLNSVGYLFIPTPMLEIQPLDVAADMGALAAKMRLSMPEAFAALVDWTARQQNKAIAADQRLAEIARRRAVANDNAPCKRGSKRPD
ncbi:hypothetical protein [Tardiphaga sp. 11_C7_N12_6]|uniref:hypothetical protein n=1 Tax=Tardiphaga sp. 11_C7_N12_6 TaxID=3240789 RepID=UPI003F2184A6